MTALLSEEIKVTQVVDATAGAAGVTAINSDSVDMEGFEGVLFVAIMGAILATAVTSVNAAQSEDDSSFADLEGTGQTIADDDDEQLFAIDVYRPGEQYVRVEVSRGTANATVQSVLAIQYGPNSRATAFAVANAINLEQHVAPDEGTA